MKQNDDIQAAVDGVLIALLLVAAVHQVDVVLEDRKPAALKIGLALDGHFVRFVLAGIVEDKNLFDFRAQIGRDAMQRLPQRRFGVVSDNQDSDAGITHLMGTHTPEAKPDGRLYSFCGARCRGHGDAPSPKRMQVPRSAWFVTVLPEKWFLARVLQRETRGRG